MERRWDEVGGLTKQLRQQLGLAAAQSEELAAVHAKVEPRKAKTDLSVETLKVVQKELADLKAVLDDQRTRLDAAGARMIELSCRSDVVKASTAVERNKFM